MPTILAENLSGKSVMGSDGTELGRLYNITMDLKTGELSDLIVDPETEAQSRLDLDFEVDDEDRYLIPVHHVQAVKDYIVVER